MNKQWIEDSQYDAEYILITSFARELTRSDYLIVVGLFETDWMIDDHTEYSKGEYGYPR